jgi:hypothetical protein
MVDWKAAAQARSVLEDLPSGGDTHHRCTPSAPNRREMGTLFKRRPSQSDSLHLRRRAKLPYRNIRQRFSRNDRPSRSELGRGRRARRLGKESVFDAHLLTLAGSPEAWNTASGTSSHPGRDTLPLWPTTNRESRNERTGVNFCRSTVIKTPQASGQSLGHAGCWTFFIL